jgi:hypothetical protein
VTAAQAAGPRPKQRSAEELTRRTINRPDLPPSALELATPIGQNAPVSFDIFLQGLER